MELFGFEITRKKDELRVKETQSAKSFVPPVDDDGTPVIQQQAGYISGGAYGAYVDMEGGIKNESELIRRYRETSLVPECDSAIEDIVNECITSDITDRIVALDLRDVKLSDSIKNKMQDEFAHRLHFAWSAMVCLHFAALQHRFAEIAKRSSRKAKARET